MDVPSLLAQTATPRQDLKAYAAKTDAEARKTADDFEAAFLSNLLAMMSDGVEAESPFGGGHGEAMMRSMMNDEHAKAITRQGGIGISDAVYRQILKMQEGA